MKLKVLTVSQVNDSLSSYIYANPIFSSVRVVGEVFNLKKTAYGYTFLSLKDDMSKISAMTYLEDFDVKVGDTITVQGKINLYKKGGTYSLLINSYEKSGRGQEYENFKILYEKLEKAGYFKSKIKKAIPKFPQSIGVITSASGAAVQDIMAVIKRRYPVVKLYIYDSKMQGEYVEQSVINGIRRLEEVNVDTIIISRGGGDFDDLSSFNSENIAKAVYECSIPIISAIGHEIDFVICDFVADMRASTPTMAGELSVPDISELRTKIRLLESKLISSYKNEIIRYKNTLTNCISKIKSNAPYKKISDKKNHISKLEANLKVEYEKKILELKSYIEKLDLDLKNKYEKKIQQSKNKVDFLISVIEENNYVKIMSKGFAIVEKQSKVVKSSKDLKDKDIIRVKMIDGTISAVVKGE
ncbi:exodeoxyribonuclease VII, large subunit [[Eubacterium] yurii subsp. margaretiae ATCC 43715]|nr:exodeoxyribonuclease VII, large subunit [[Eubacterium] yurii subsp. margaretiae ATCC 43715]